MQILILGSDNLAGPLRSLGHQVLFCGRDPEADLPLKALDPDWRDLAGALGSRGFLPEAVLVTDNLGLRTLPTGIWACPAVTAFYGIDAPLNHFWQIPYARLFDLAFWDQPQEAGEFSEFHSESHWLPVGVDYSLYAGDNRQSGKQGVCFVGALEPKVRPKRSALLNKVAKVAPLSVFGGRQGKWLDTRTAAELYRSYDVVLNENLFPGVTTRPLEGMAARACVFTEAAPGAMDRLFPEYEALVYFSPQDWEMKLLALLGDAALRKSLAGQARECVKSGHTLEHRAAEIVSHFQRLRGAGPEMGGRAQGAGALRLEGEALLMAGLRWPRAEPHRLERALGRLRAATAQNPASLFGMRMAGQAEAACGNWTQALAYLQKANEMGDEGDCLALGLAAWQAGDAPLARRVCSGLAARQYGLDCDPDSAGFHLGAARLLDGIGRDLSPGFDRKACGPCSWNALEHLAKAVSLEPGLAGAWEFMGDILMRRHAPNQAWDCYRMALNLGHEERLDHKARQAAWEGYII